VEVCLYDRKGVTEKAFKRLGLDFRPVRSALGLKGEEVLVVGRESLDKELFRERAIASFLEKGGRMLILEQVDEALFPERMGIRLKRQAAGRRLSSPLATRCFGGLTKRT